MNLYRFIRPMFSRRPVWVAAIRRSSKPACSVPARSQAIAWVIPDLRRTYRSLGAALPEVRRRLRQRERNLRWQLKVLPRLGVVALHLQLMTEPTPVETVAPPRTFGFAERSQPVTEGDGHERRQSAERLHSSRADDGSRSLPYRSLKSRSISRRTSRRLMSSRLSKSFLPFAMASSHFTNPRLR
jgi:hypothetical protein